MKRSIFTDLFIYSYEVDRKAQAEKKYRIRVVGLVTDEEVAKLSKNNELLKSTYNSETISLMDVASNRNIEGLRLAGAVVIKNNVRIYDKKVFISEKIDFVCQAEFINQQETLSRLMLNTSNGSFIVAEERVTTDQNIGLLAGSI